MTDAERKPTMTFDCSGHVRCSCGGECEYKFRGKWRCRKCRTWFSEADDNVIVRPPRVQPQSDGSGESETSLTERP